MKKLLCACLLFISTSANATGLEFTGTIKTVYLGPMVGDMVFIQVNGTSSGNVACHQDQFDYVFNASTETGKVYLSAVLAAYTAQKTIRLRSTDSCDIYSVVPTLKDVWLK